MNQLKEFFSTLLNWLSIPFQLLKKNEKFMYWYEKTHRKVLNFWRKYRMNKVIILIGLWIILAGSTYLVFLAKTSDVSTLKQGLAQETIIFDKDGDEAGTVSRNKGTFVPLESISPVMQKAVVSTEDKRFYEHHGFDLKGIGRAAVSYIIHFGRIGGGGSTITQQLAKNAYLTLDQTFSRKIKELFLALEIERIYTKNEILEMYLNHAYFGNGVYGIQDASERYFGKNASELSLSESATLTGMLKGPSIYNPVDDYDRAINRRNTVLTVMESNGAISSEEATQAAGEGFNLVNNYQAPQDYRYPDYFDAVINEAIYEYGLTEEEIMERGYRIYTTLDQTMQMQMDAAYRHNNFPDADDGTVVQSASIAMDPSTGGVRALFGGRNEDGEHVFRGFNRATQMRVAPASTLKPLVVYTPALEAGYTPEDLLKDEKLSYGSDQYTPENWNHAYQGQVTMTEALQMSWNAPAVWLMDKVGLDKGINKLKQFGIKTTKDDKYLGLALGGMTKGVSPMMMASAYTTFANQGIRSKGFFIRQIVDASGKVIVSNKRPTTYKVTTPKVAQTMTQMMLNVYSDYGTGASAQNGYVMAGKTGTTETENNEGVAAQWMIAYTPDIVVATWLGFDETTANHRLFGSAAENISPLFSQEMANIIEVTNQTPFGVERESNGLIDQEVENQINQTMDKVKKQADIWINKAKILLDEQSNKWGNQLHEWLD
ncbi:transglycosylase domain-containing protein [Atopobacter phocae]|uniref:transglycosylase domain-containing protein n=1 Tax=Atopobacter phocae TaxID=136492 RepID=UPI00046F9D36|nr:PBP1A family penicillin-binding protein [Atopobacter phocae]